ncbi:MAG: TonB-dependent receptor [Paludibacteraceae bacterium]|nr:TonB-dependent receptor [Paludibacteraceae bacterium]
MRKFLLIIFFQLVVLISFGQNYLRGKILDETGTPLKGVTVVLQGLDRSVLSDNEGRFEFQDLKANRALLQIDYTGYDAYADTVKVPADVQINLRKSSFLLDEVVVASIRVTDKSPVAYSTVTKKDIALANLGQDVPYLLNTTPSFVATSDAGTGVGYTNFRIRGTDAGRINITVNGIPINDPEEQIMYWVDMPDLSSSVENIQIQRGVGTSTNGAGAFGATISMQTEALNVKPYAEVGSSYGSFNTNKNTLKVGSGLLNGHWAFDARLSNITSDGYIDRASVDMKSYYFSGGYYGKKTILKAVIFGGVEKTYHAWDGVPGDSLSTNRTYNPCGQYTDNNGNVQYYKNQTDNYDQKNYQLHFSHQVNKNLNANVALHYTHGIGYYEEYQPGQKLANYNITSTYASDSVTDLITQKWMENDFYGVVYSLNYTRKKISCSLGGAANQYDGVHYGYVTWFKDMQNATNEYEWYRNHTLKTDVNVYGKVNYELLKGLDVYGDLQYRYVNIRMTGTEAELQNLDFDPKFNFFNPKGGLHYALNKHNAWYASVSVANKEPNRTNYTEAGADESPTSERLTDYELGYLFKNDVLSLGANLYYMDYKNQLILTGKVSEIGEALTSNIPQSYREGVELMAGINFFKGLRWSGNVTLSENKIKNFTEYDVDVYDVSGNWTGTQNNVLGKTDIAYSPNIIANSLLSFLYHDFGIALQSNYVGKQYIDNTSSNDCRLDAYFVNNLRFNYSLKLKQLKSIDFSFAVNNILNEKYSSNGYVWYSSYEAGQRMNDLRYFPQAEINFMGGVSLKF